MSHVGTVHLHIYQGEDWSSDVEFSGDGAPASLAGWTAFMELRTTGGKLVRRLTVGNGITVVAGATNPTWRVRIPKAETRELPVGSLRHDFFAVPDDADTFAVFRGDTTVESRVTVEEDA